MNKTNKKVREFKPDYVVNPSVVVEEMAAHKYLGSPLIKRVEEGTLEKSDISILSALLKVPKYFFTNLEANYQKELKRLWCCRECYVEHETKWEFQRENNCKCKCHGVPVKKHK